MQDAGSPTDGLGQVCLITGHQSDQDGGQKRDPQRDPAEQEEGLFHGRGPSFGGQRRQLPRSVRGVDLLKNRVFRRDGLLPEQQMIGAVQQGNLQTLGLGVHACIRQQERKVQNDGYQPPETVSGVNGLLCRKGESLGTKRIRIADHDFA